MAIDPRITAVGGRIAAARSMISPVAAQNEDPGCKKVLQDVENLVNDIENFFLSRALKEDYPLASTRLDLAENAMHLAEKHLTLAEDAVAKARSGR